MDVPSKEEFRERFVRNAEGGEQTCRSCQKKWTPSGWNFWGLCDECFPRWNAVRVMLPPQEYDTYTHVTPEKGYYTSCDEWLKDGSPDPPDEPFRIHYK